MAGARPVLLASPRARCAGSSSTTRASAGSRKRRADRPHLPIEAAHELPGQPTPDLLELDRALAELAALDPLKASIVELRFFIGLSLEATAEVLGCSRPTVVRHWAIARTWLYAALEGRPGGDQ